MTRFGKILEASGLAFTAAGLIYGIVYDDISYEVKMLFLGIVVFFSGWFIGRRRK